MQMREVLASCLEEFMAADKKVVVIDADLAKADGTANLSKKFPEQAFDVGIAEQNMASVAAGMASYGFKPYITSFSPFATRRLLDQLTISIAYSKQNVKIVGTDPGITAEVNGGTHMGLEDIGCLRSVAGVAIFEPSDPDQLRAAMPQINAYDGPLYIRLFRKDLPVIHAADYRFDLFKADVLREGKDVTLFVSGFLTADALKTADELAAEGIAAEVVEVHTIKPVDADTVCASVAKTGCAVTIENHNVVGGFGSAILETIAEAPVPTVRVGVPDRFGEVGKLPYLRKVMGMTLEDIVAAAKKAVSLKK
ncbi:MAG: transketolase family protein [Clostridia bacterium]|nr:transketolase family protein [Clostridia bacterium]